MKHEDSFIYLSSINGLAVMANVFPNTVIKALVEEYAEMGTKRTVADNNNSSAELKMKVGEVLVRVTKLLGKYYVKKQNVLVLEKQVNQELLTIKRLKFTDINSENSKDFALT